mmetsp:Transcript_29011/g.47911  ORF Transcript_29011/g.47911 Transcript_29011/m.47911 type:complete len:200 (+) Transcript_29011:55-654(+)
MKCSSLLLLVVLGLSSTEVVLGQVVPDEEDDCPSIPLCCEEDCCGPNSSYNGTDCSFDLNAPGFAGVYSVDYIFGCSDRECCLGECCGHNTAWDAVTGYCVVPLGSIAGNVSADLDNNDTGDVDLEGSLIELFDASGALIATRATDAMGNYLFLDLPPGEYTVVQTNLPAFPTDVSDIDPDTPMNTINVTLGDPPFPPL